MALPIEKYEDQFLAPYALKHSLSGGRFFPEVEDSYRTNIQRDRDRIIHSKAFRRLGYKTQVFVNTKGDSYRTRLTHSLEVSQLSRSIANVLKLNKDLSEAIALAHDIGHSPFGHAGQEILDQLMNGSGGFEHNKQILRIVTLLEERYPNFTGLNLTRATLKALIKHNQVYEDDVHLHELFNEKKNQFPCLESVLVDQCDRIAYIHHDIEDGMDSNYLDLDALFDLEYWNKIKNTLEKQWKHQFKNARASHKIKMILRYSLNLFVTDFIENSKKNLEKLQLNSIEEVYKLDVHSNPLKNSNEFIEIMNETYKFLKENLYHHPEVRVMSYRGQRIIQYLFYLYVSHPEFLPSHIQKNIPKYKLERTVCDYISGMTDRYAISLYEKFK
ncbi:MAG: dGTP triphosphohydrolase [Leptonema sp. (in: bacteria)]